VADGGDKVTIRCVVEFRAGPGDPPAIVTARRWFKATLRAWGGRMIEAAEVKPPDGRGEASEGAS